MNPSITMSRTESLATQSSHTVWIEKALPMEGFRIFQKVRPGLVAISDSVREAALAHKKGTPPGPVFIGLGMDVLGKFPEETLDTAMVSLFRHVKFTRNGVPTPVVLAKDLDGGTKGLELHEILELLVRAFCVNFSASSDALMSLWDKVTEDDGEDAPESETSTPSSPIPSTLASADTAT